MRKNQRLQKTRSMEQKLLGWFFLALILMIIPLPLSLQFYRPYTVLLVIFYWTLMARGAISLTLIWLLGLFTDLCTGTLFGQHAVAFVAVVYLLMKWQSQFRSFSLLQQSLFVLGFAGMAAGIEFWIFGVFQKITPPGAYWGAALLTGLCWPWFGFLLKRRDLHLSGLLS